MGTMDLPEYWARNRTPWKWPPLRLRQNGLSRSLTPPLTGVARTAREFLELRNDESTLRQLPIQEITSKDVYDAAVSGRQTI